MFRQHIACHHQGTLVFLAKITIKHAHARGVRGVAAYLYYRYACHHQGALVVLAKITIKHAHARGVRGVAAYL